MIMITGRTRFGSIRFGSRLFRKLIGSVRFGSEMYLSRFDEVRPALFGRVVARSGSVPVRFRVRFRPVPELNGSVRFGAVRPVGFGFSCFPVVSIIMIIIIIIISIIITTMFPAPLPPPPPPLRSR